MMRLTSSRRRAFHQPPGRENARRHVEYAIVKGVYLNGTDKAVLLTTERMTVPTWIPLRKVEPASRLVVGRATKDMPISIQVELETALEKGLV
ncbi:hypothetical protein [uncultured Devosia sp.]|uniref:hypothetical protein n=1 Tax=uncultured Devosia sp. TaxID=211434 RepID=UPI002613BDE6|nr:hypothetical protein [uncultured Devosia sp.]